MNFNGFVKFEYSGFVKFKFLTNFCDFILLMTFKMNCNGLKSRLMNRLGNLKFAWNSTAIKIKQKPDFIKMHIPMWLSLLPSQKKPRLSKRIVKNAKGKWEQVKLL